MKNSLKIFVSLLLAIYAHAALAQADMFGFGELKDDINLRDSLSDLTHAKAAKWSSAGDNILVEGDVFLPLGKLRIYADRAIINTKTKDIEAVGNIRLYRVNQKKMTLTIDDLIRLRNRSEVLVAIEGYSTDSLGNQMVNVEVTIQGGVIRADRIIGNLNSGVLEMSNISVRYNSFICRAEHAVRKPSGELNVTNAELTTCEYFDQGNGHYSIFLKTGKFYPYINDEFGFSGKQSDMGDHSIWGWNALLKIYGIPLFWVPFFYKPKDESPGLFGVQWGHSSEFGFMLNTYKRFDLTDYPYSTIKLFADYYSMRGFGYGAEAEVSTENSKTFIDGYSIYDMRPYKSSDVEKERLKIPHFRYGLELSNVTHITPKLDFRGRFSLSSDYYFRKDFDSPAYNANPEPSTFASLEYQFERATTSLYMTARVNDFYTSVERLPEFRIDLPRQELFWNIYHQGELSLSNLQMKWREYDKPRRTDPLTNRPFPGNKDYHAFRMDTLHMFYFPIRLPWFHVTPRTGFRMTYYDHSSRREITSNDLGTMGIADEPEDLGNGTVPAYDRKGGSRTRFVMELGVEANTKIYHSWQNVKNTYLQLDGLRHVMEPYLNYTFIPEPTEDRKHLYFFDEVDRIKQQNFIRLGIKQRIQTRRGNYGNETIYNWLTMETYWDYHFQNQDGFNNSGDLVHRMTFSPMSDLQIGFLVAIDAGKNSDHDLQANRRGRDAGRPGISSDLINKLELSINYTIFSGCSVRARYSYADPYRSRPAYSMGSTFHEVDGGSSFDRYYYERTQQITFGFTVPLTMDRSFRGDFDVSYDFEAGYVSEIRVRLVKTLHCWDVALELSQNRSYSGEGDIEYDRAITVMFYLNGLSGPLNRMQNSAAKRVRNYSM